MVLDTKMHPVNKYLSDDFKQDRPLVSPVGLKMPEQTFQQTDVNVKPAGSYTDPAASMETHVNNLIKSDNPLLQSVNTRVKQAGEARGLLNSMGNIRAGEAAVLDKATQIAAPDVAAEQSRISQQQAIENQGAMNTQAAGYNFQNQQNQARITGALQEQQQGFQSATTRDTQQFQEHLTKLGYDNQKVQQLTGIYGNLVDSMVSSMGAIMRSPDNVWNTKKQEDFDNVINSAKGWLATAFNIPLS